MALPGDWTSRRREKILFYFFHEDYELQKTNWNIQLCIAVNNHNFIRKTRSTQTIWNDHTSHHIFHVLRFHFKLIPKFLHVFSMVIMKYFSKLIFYKVSIRCIYKCERSIELLHSFFMHTFLISFWCFQVGLVDHTSLLKKVGKRNR